jgi:hypothetical protein
MWASSPVLGARYVLPRHVDLSAAGLFRVSGYLAATFTALG